MTRFTDKVVLVTGASRGIGLACAERFASEGAIVFTAQRGTNPFNPIGVDFSDLTACEKLIREIIERAGQLDVLINNAGVMEEGTVEKTTLDAWHHTLQINLTVPFLLTKYAMPYLRAAEGCIVNIGSIEGLSSNPRHPAYCTSKAGLHGLTRAVAVDHGREGVRCNAVAPGWIDTELNNDFIDSMSDPSAFRKQIGDIHPVGRTGATNEVAATVAFLASDDANFITGQVYTVDGGRMAKLSLP